jgi:hypothetical protein
MFKYLMVVQQNNPCSVVSCIVLLLGCLFGGQSGVRDSSVKQHLQKDQVCLYPASFSLSCKLR